MIRRAVTLAVLALAVTLSLAGCGSAARSASVNGAVPAQLQFTATTVDGAEFAGESLLGKPVAFWFWAPWCSTCQREATVVGEAATAHPAVTFIGVASASELPAMREFVEKYPVQSLTNLADTSGTVWAKFGVTTQPAFAFLSSDGHVDVVTGALSKDDLDARLVTLTGS